jgi:hypothetical protein
MATLHPWTSVEIGDQDLFTPTLPSQVVYTWYDDAEPESTVMHIWRDAGTGIIHHEHVLVAPLTFEEAVSRAQEEAVKRNVERIHVKHARSPNQSKTKAKAPAKVATSGAEKRNPASRAPAKRRPR